MQEQRENQLLGRQQVRFVTLAVAGMLAVSLGLLTGCSRSEGASRGPMGPLPVTVVGIQTSNVPVKSQWVGTLDGYVNAQIQPQVSGYLIKQNYREGSLVHAGDVLFEIDPRPFQAALDQAEGQLGQAQGQLGQAQAQLELANINVNRDTPLAAQHAIAQSQLDNELQQKAQAEAGVKLAQAAILTAKANIETAKLNLGFTQVRSLITGVAGQATTQVGNLVSPQSVLTAVSQLDPIKVYFSISDKEYLALTQQAQQGGGDLLKASDKLPLTLTLANGEVYPHPGHIVFVDRQMNQQTGAIRIAAAFPNSGNILRPGQFGRVSANTQIMNSAILVPQVAVQELQGIQQVATVTPDDKVHVVNVQLGAQYGNDWIVIGGLQPGARVIVDNLQKLREGMPVKPHEIPIAAAAAATSSTSISSDSNATAGR